MPFRRAGVVLAVSIGVVAVLAPIWLSIELARRQSMANLRGRTQSYARDVMHRVDETKVQVGAAVNGLKKANLPPCSEQEVDLMRQLDLTSSYIQAVGRLSGTQLSCTSLGTVHSIELGPPDVITENGVYEWMSAHMPLDSSYPLTVVGRDGVAVLIDPSLPVDTVTEGPDVAIAVYPPSSPKHLFIASQGKGFRTEWFRTIAKGTTVSFVDGGYIVTLMRSPDSDTAVIAAVPQHYAGQGLRRFVLIFVPIGLLCGGLLAWAVLYISRIQFSLPAMLKAAARKREFFVVYQPLVDLETRRWVGAEALVRWKRKGKIIPPDEFIPVAESSGVITQITECVMAKVATDLPRMLEMDPEFRVGINLSAADINSGNAVEMLRTLMSKSGAKPENIEVEATERGFLQGLASRNTIAAMRALGVRVAIDDFGTGYSSLSCLQTLGLDTLKIDKAFVETIGTDGATSQVVPHIIDMAHSMKLEMVAEGVETEAQAEFLARRGVGCAQGWLFGRPMTVAALCAGLQTQRTTPQVIPA